VCHASPGEDRRTSPASQLSSSIDPLGPAGLRAEYDDRESVSLATNPHFMEIIERSRARARSEGTRSLEEVRRKYGLKSKKGRSRKVR
jgi:hypothetical protein